MLSQRPENFHLSLEELNRIQQALMQSPPQDMRQDFLAETLTNYLKFLKGLELDFLSFIDQLSTLSTHEAFDHNLFEKLIALVTASSDVREQELQHIRMALKIVTSRKRPQSTLMRTGEVSYEDKLQGEIEQLKVQAYSASAEERFSEAFETLIEAVRLSKLCSYPEKLYENYFALGEFLDHYSNVIYKKAINESKQIAVCKEHLIALNKANVNDTLEVQNQIQELQKQFQKLTSSLEKNLQLTINISKEALIQYNTLYYIENQTTQSNLNALIKRHSRLIDMYLFTINAMKHTSSLTREEKIAMIAAVKQEIFSSLEWLNVNDPDNILDRQHYLISFYKSLAIVSCDCADFKNMNEYLNEAWDTLNQLRDFFNDKRVTLSANQDENPPEAQLEEISTDLIHCTTSLLKQSLFQKFKDCENSDLPHKHLRFLILLQEEVLIFQNHLLLGYESSPEETKQLGFRMHDLLLQAVLVDLESSCLTNQTLGQVQIDLLQQVYGDLASFPDLKFKTMFIEEVEKLANQCHDKAKQDLATSLENYDLAVDLLTFLKENNEPIQRDPLLIELEQAIAKIVAAYHFLVIDERKSNSASYRIIPARLSFFAQPEVIIEEVQNASEIEPDAEVITPTNVII